MNIECPTPAYNRLMKSGIVDIILKKEREIKDFLIYRDIFADKKSERISDEARKFIFDWSNPLSDRWKCFADIALLDSVLDSEDFIIDLKSFFVEYPSFVSYYLLGEKLFNYADCGFPSRRSLEESIASFIAGEITFSERSYIWRNGDMKNEISSNEHGDFYSTQKNVFGEDNFENNLFGKSENFDTMKRDVISKGIFAYQDWSMFLWSLLKYSEKIDKQYIPEIINWRDVIEETGFIGTSTSEAIFGSGRYNFDFEFERCILSEDKVYSWPIVVGKKFFPYYEGGKLFFLEENEKGEIGLNTKTRFDNLRFSESVVFDETDLPHALRATYKFYARDRSELTKIMECFLKSQ